MNKVNKIDPPKLAIRFLQWFCPASLYEGIEGDLLEQYEADVKNSGEKTAKRRLIWNVVKFFRSGILLRNRISIRLNPLDMILNHFQVALRHLSRNRFFAMVNVVGLAVGMSAFFLIAHYISFETTYDQFHENRDNIYRVGHIQRQNGEITNSSVGTFFGAGQFLKDNFTEVEEVVHFYNWPASTGVIVRSDNKVFNERSYFFAEPSFFKVFPSLLTKGNADKCLREPNNVVLSKKLALKIFGTEDVIGRTLERLDEKGKYAVVTGVMMDLPANSHFDLDIVLSYDAEWIPKKEDDWRYASHWTYLTLKPGADVRKLEANFNAALNKTQRDNPEWKNTSAVFQSIKDIHLTSQMKRDEIKVNGNKSLVYGLGIAAMAILFIAWINYVNLETSRFLSRLKEVSIRKIIGSSRRQLIAQFFTQYTCLNVLAILIAAVMVYMVLPYFEWITGVPATAPIFEGPSWTIAFIFFIVGALVTGIYPALYLIRFNPSYSLKGKVVGGIPSILKKILMTFQFVTSFALIAFLIVLNDQLEFMRLSRKSIDVDQVLTIYNSTGYTFLEDSLRKERSLSFRNVLLQNPQFTSLTASSAVPGEPVGFTYENFTKRSLTDPDDGIPYKVIFVDYYFNSVFGLKLKAGRMYSPESGEDNNLNSIVLNESAVHALGFASADEALNKEIYFMVTFDWKKYKIIGILEDYNHESVKAPVQPSIFYLHNYVGQMTYYSMRIDRNAHMKTALAAAEKSWEEVWPEKPFVYFFMDEHYDQQYKSEIHVNRIFTSFAGGAIFLAALGVLGMTLFETNLRLREISIRKVLGASVSHLLVLLSRSHLRMILISVVVAIPIVFFVSREWLAHYPIHIDFSLLFIVIPALIILVVVLGSAGIQTLKTAQTNPVNHLKNE